MPSFYNVKINFTRNSVRHLPDADMQRVEARGQVKLLLAPQDGKGIITESMISNDLVTDAMIDRYLSIEPPQVAVVPEFDPIIDEIERAYVLGLYFSALSAACVTIERLLNFLRIKLHQFHPGTVAEIDGFGPIENWKKNIDALVEWGYLKEDEFTTKVRKQYKLRSKYLHNGPLNELQEDALTSINIAYDLLKKFLGFPPELFDIGPSAGISCKDSSHPLFRVFYAPTIVTTPEEQPLPPPAP